MTETTHRLDPSTRLDYYESKHMSSDSVDPVVQPVHVYLYLTQSIGIPDPVAEIVS